MNTLEHAVRWSLWVGVGAAFVLSAGCAGTISKSPVTALTGAQEVPPVTTSASGSTDIAAWESKCPAATSSSQCPTIAGRVWTTGFAGTSAEVHQGAPGQNGPAIVTLTKVDDNTWVIPTATTITPAQYSAYWAGQLYVNVHSTANQNGEVRAQLKP